MPIAARLRLNVTARRDPQTVRIRINTRSRNTGVTDFANITLAVTHELADAVASSWRLLGLTIELDDGTGLRTLTAGELAGTVSMTSSLDTLGRVLNFSVYLPNGSPFRSDLLRGMRRVRVTGYMGTSPATMQPRVMFDGYIHSVVFAAYPPVAQITAQDASLLYAEKRLTLDVPEGSGLSRETHAIQVLSAYTIPYGSLDLGPNNGGIVKKAMQVGGDQNVLPWLGSFITPTGRRMRFNQRLGQLEIAAFDETSTPVRALTAADVNNLTITPPGTADANQVWMSGTAVTLVSSASSGTTTPDGTLTSGLVVTDAVTVGDYQPQVAVKVQSHIDGTISDIATPPAARAVVVSAVKTSTQIDVTSDRQTVTVREIVDTYGYYAQRAAQFHITNSAGVLAWNTIFDVYLFSDGSSRAVTVETYQHLSRTETVKIYRGGTLRSTAVTVGKWDRDVIIPYAGGAFTSGTNVLVTASREQWAAGGGGKDAYFDIVTQTLTTYTIAPDGQHLQSIFELVNSQLPGSAGTVFSGYTYQNTGDPTTGQLAETLQSSIHAEQIANLEKAVADPQSLTAKATDTVRQALTTLVISQQQNDFCENLAELQTAAFYALRDLSKFKVEFDMPIDLTLDEGSVFTMPIPIVGCGDDPVVVGSIAWQFEGKMAQNSQHVIGWWYPPNLRIAA